MKRTLRSELSLEEQESLRKRDREVYHVKRKDKPEYKMSQRNTYERLREKNKPIEKNRTLKRKYGLTLADYQELFEQQNGVCAICARIEENRMLAVDHCHDETGRVRGLLCGTCNRALGLFKDSPELLAKAKEYVS